MKSDEFRQIRRDVLRLSQEALADQLGVTRRTIIRIEGDDIVRKIYVEAIRGLTAARSVAAE